MRIIAGEARGRRLHTPKDDSIRPLLDQIRESIFSSLDSVLLDRYVLDLFSGIGSFGLEALSRGARRAVFVDRSASSLAILRRNIENLSFGPRSEIIQGDALRVPQLSGSVESTFGVVFLDPPFKMFDSLEGAGIVFDRVQQILLSPSMATDGVLILRHPSKFRGDCPLKADSRKIHGQSVVLLFRRAGPSS